MAVQLPASSFILALDVGERRIGVALASPIARISSPYRTVINDQTVWDVLGDIIHKENIGHIVVGLPRNLSGDDTAQTKICRDFAAKAEETFGIMTTLQDEALTSQKAEDELRSRGRDYAKSDIDALAAAYILEDYLGS